MPHLLYWVIFTLFFSFFTLNVYAVEFNPCISLEPPSPQARRNLVGFFIYCLWWLLFSWMPSFPHQHVSDNPIVWTDPAFHTYPHEHSSSFKGEYDRHGCCLQEPWHKSSRQLPPCQPRHPLPRHSAALFFLLCATLECPDRCYSPCKISFLHIYIYQFTRLHCCICSTSRCSCRSFWCIECYFCHV